MADVTGAAAAAAAEAASAMVARAAMFSETVAAAAAAAAASTLSTPADWLCDWLLFTPSTSTTQKLDVEKFSQKRV